MAALVAGILSRCGFQVDRGQDAPSALAKIGQSSYDLILLDLILPGADGFSLLHEINNRSPGQRVMVLSARGDVDTKVRCLDLGAVDYVAKPFLVGELVARVRARTRDDAGSVGMRFLELGGLRLDLSQRVVLTRGRRVRLSEREFRLLEFIMKKGGDVCTREELLGGVWECWFDPGTNVVDVYVRRLRKKIGTDAIETIRGVGYRCGHVESS